MKYVAYNKLNFGTAGIPISTPDRAKVQTVGGIEYVKELGLSGMELEFVRNVNISREKAPLIKEAAIKNEVELTCHGQYFINLNSLEPEKIDASIQRILNAANIANLCGAKSLTFHAGFYQGIDKDKTFDNIKKSIKFISDKLNQDGNKIMIRPETTGKATQWGDVDEILRLASEVERVLPCIDFSHLHARSNGKFNTKEEFDSVLTKVEKVLGREALGSMHIHVSGINYTPKGERNHLILEESDFNYKELMKSFKEFNIKGVLICESPNIEEDGTLMRDEYNNL